MKNIIASAGAGAVAGGATHATIGGMGLAVGGTAIGITFVPMVAIGAGAALIVYGIFRLGKSRRNKKEN